MLTTPCVHQGILRRYAPRVAGMIDAAGLSLPYDVLWPLLQVRSPPQPFQQQHADLTPAPSSDRLPELAVGCPPGFRMAGAVGSVSATPSGLLPAGLSVFLIAAGCSWLLLMLLLSRLQCCRCCRIGCAY